MCVIDLFGFRINLTLQIDNFMYNSISIWQGNNGTAAKQLQLFRK